MGVFAEWQPRYAQHGIATFPTKDKKPAIKGWQNIGMGASKQFALKFPSADEIAFHGGRRSGITVIDVDTQDENQWRDAIKRFGETRIMVRTGSGHLQLWYRFNGEPRKVRAESCIDILGAGPVLGFPSKRGMGYELLRGGLECLGRLPFARNVNSAPHCALIGQGGRSNAMLEHLRSQYRYCDDLKQLMDVGRTFADQRFDRLGGHEYSDNEIRNQASAVWKWCQER
jgi:Bifunctional DNA primase/polymerase, N-terminal